MVPIPVLLPSSTHRGLVLLVDPGSSDLDRRGPAVCSPRLSAQKAWLRAGAGNGPQGPRCVHYATLVVLRDPFL